jgi:hypothetical protein
MSRSYGKVFVDIWRDRDFLARSPEAQRLYLLLCSQANLNSAGVLPLQVKRWSKLSEKTSEADIRAALDELAEHRFIVVDEDTEEVLIRSFIRRDEWWKNPKHWIGIKSTALDTASDCLRIAIRLEIERLAVDNSLSGVDKFLSDLVTDQAIANPITNPLSTDREPDANGLAPVVVGYVSLQGETPTPTTETPPPPSVDLALNGAAPSPEQAGAEGQPRDLMGSLIAQVQDVRPEWGSTAIRTTLERARADGRPWNLTRDAMIRVANAPDSRAPARLLEQGPWWNEAANGSGVKPPRPADLKKCPTHPGELASNCRCCAADRKAS